MITSGSRAVEGGGVGNFGRLTIECSTIAGNTAEFSGGGIAHGVGALLVVESTVSDNTAIVTAGGGGGGIASGFGGSITIRNSTVSGNRAWRGGGLYNITKLEAFRGSTVTLNNVTVANNVGGGGAGGIFNAVTPAPDPSQIPSLYIANSLIAGNGAGDCTGQLISRGYNLIQDTTACTLVGDPTGNLLGLDAVLSPLADNGGPTRTHALGGGSPASNAGNTQACESSDQRGVARPRGPACDIGAYEGSCGDTTVDPGEQCDDGNGTSGDGCDTNCTFTACGNRVVSPDEECDDGGTSGGDCCSPTCRLDPLGTPCATDDNACTDDVCDGAGTCGHVDNAAPCDDGNPCSPDDRCQDGRCTAFHQCSPCLICSPGVGCIVPPADCQPPPPGGSRLVIRDHVDDRRDSLVWRWTSSASVSKFFDFGAPTSGFEPYRLCVYAATSDTLVFGFSSGPSGPCWKETEEGWKCEARRLTPDGALRVKLRGGGAGQAEIRVRAKGSAVGLPALPLAVPLRVRLDRSYGFRCWDATYDASIRTNRASILRAVSE